MAYRAVQPAQYISQYDPAMEQRMQDVMVASQVRYDQAFNNILGEQARQGEIFFLNPEDKKIAQSGFRSQVNDILQRYEGDYGAASKELSKAIVAERNNPAYQLSQYQVQRVNDYQKELQRIGPENALVINDPTKDISIYKDGQLKSVSDFDFKIYDKSKIQAKGMNWLSQLKPKERALELDPASGGQYWRSIKEVTPESFNELLTDEKINSFLETTPELREIAISQGKNPIEFARNYLKAQGEGIIGIPQIEYLANKNYDKNNNFGGYSSYFRPKTSFGNTIEPGQSPFIKDIKDFKDTDINSQDLKGSNKNKIVNEIESDDVLNNELLTTINNYNSLVKNIWDKAIVDPNFITQLTAAEQEGIELTSFDQYTKRLKDQIGAFEYSLSKGRNSDIEGIKNLSKDERKELQNNLNSIKNNLDNFNTKVENNIKSKLQAQNLDPIVQFEGIDNLIGPSKTMNEANTIKNNIQTQLDDINLDRFDFISGPDKTKFIGKDISMDKRQDNDIYKKLKQRGEKRLTSIGISNNNEIMFRIQDKEGNEYTITPRDQGISESIIKGFEPTVIDEYGYEIPTGPYGFSNDRYFEIKTFNEQIENAKKANQDLDMTFRDHIKYRINNLYPDLPDNHPLILNMIDGYTEAIKNTGLTVDSKIRKISL